MKFKKLLISASAIAAGSGLLATVLTSCAKANVDEKLKITLDDNGLLYNPGKMGDAYKITFSDAIRSALTHSATWAQFKTAVADEVIYQWYLDRAATSKSDDKKNANFRTSLDEWQYQIDKDYNDIIQTCKNKYGANWGFYLQNEYLAPLGGTEAAYKHAKLVEKVKTDFITKVFAKSYFGFKTQDFDKAGLGQYKHIFAKASRDVNPDKLRNPENWGNIGFFARADLSFPITDAYIPETIDKVNTDFLAKHPEGDYAAIQDYVFNRWFKTEKPFFSAAALFKYSMPKYVAGGKLDQIFNATRTGVKLPDKPNEAFPFFGAGDDSSTRKANDFIEKLEAGRFATDYNDKAAGKSGVTNGTVTIPLSSTDDSQTLLLVSGAKMFGELYTPYSMAAGNLYQQMLGYQTENSNPNHMGYSVFKGNITGWSHGSNDDFAMLKNFFYTADPTTAGIKSTLDLNKIYGGYNTSTTEYHCPLFHKCEEYPFFYGDTTQSTAALKSGIRYITNNIQIDDIQFSSETTDKQPWVIELNESGVHIQTIDGFKYVQNGADQLGNLKKVIMYRLMQKQINDDAAACISVDLLGESGKLKTYFNDNYANIILELATQNLYVQPETAEAGKYNIFRKIDSYSKSEEKDDNLMLYNIMKDEALSTSYTNFKSYFSAIIGYEMTKKEFSNLEAANTKIYSYRNKQIANAKAKEDFAKTVFENGLLAPFVYTPESKIQIGTTYDYVSVNRITCQNLDAADLNAGYVATMANLQSKISDEATNQFLKEVMAEAKVGGTTAFAPQISTAKSVASNRFWYKSLIVDKLMYAMMGNKAFTANGIKMNAYKYYTSTLDKDGTYFGDQDQHAAGRIWTNDASKNAFATTVARGKLLTGDKNLASYVDSYTNYDISKYYNTMFSTYFDEYLNKNMLDNGWSSDEHMNYELLKATVMYLISSDKTEGAKPFDNFYTLMNSKISDDESAFVGYLSKGYSESSEGAGAHILDSAPITSITAAGQTMDYKFDPNVDNMFDKTGYSGKSRDAETVDSKLSGSSYWTVVNKTLNGFAQPMSGFLGLQTKANNQLDSASGMQSEVFDNFAKASDKTWDLNAATPTAYENSRGCWFQYAGSLTPDQELIDFTFEYSGETITADEWFPKGTDYVNVRKIAQKIISRRTPDDLRTLAKTLAKSFNGYSYFSSIADGSTPCATVEDMKLKMLHLLPSPKTSTDEKAHKIDCFLRVSNAEVHPRGSHNDILFKDSKGRVSYKLMLTQVNKADITEHNLAPTWNGSTWVQGASPITPEEFWVLLFNLASESTVQQRVITEVVRTCFGDDKLIVYDAQLYNQFDSVWIKDWTKKTMGA